MNARNPNFRIRRTIRHLVRANGPMDTRRVIGLLARSYQTTRQCISGNISYMVCRAGILSIHRAYPNSVIY